jgi:hypothetical protein
MDTKSQLDYEAGRNQKQTYLYTNIVEAGYDAESFAQYMQSNRENGMEIDNWSFEDLVTVVHTFRQAHSHQAEQPELSFG